jgi:MFS family permease
MERVSALILIVAVALAGAAVMVIEVAGAQVLVTFSAGLNAWVAMISVALGGLAVGYALGGWLADRWPSAGRRLLAAALAVGGVTCAADALVWVQARDAVAGLGPRAGALLGAAMLFGPAFIALGAAYPLALKLWTRSAAEVGRRAGWLSAASAVGSLIGAVLAGFVLVPELALETVFGACATGLLLGAGALAVVARRWPAATVLLVIAVGVALLPGRPLPEGVLYRRGSMFGPLEVRGLGGQRTLMVANTVQGIALPDLDRPGAFRSNMPHTRLISGMIHKSAPGGRALLIGLGAGLMPAELEPMECVSVEIDPAVVDAAAGYFGFDRTRHPVHVADGRAWLLARNELWEVIVVDAFRGADLPHHLLTREFFELARSRLRPGGVLVINAQGAVTGDDAKLIRAIEATLRVTFGNVSLCVNPNPAWNASAVFVAHDGSVTVDWPLTRGYEARTTLVQRGGASILTDSRSPVALWSAQLDLRRRQASH